MPRLLRPTDRSQTHGKGKKTKRRPARRQGQRRRMYRMGSGAAADSAPPRGTRAGGTAKSARRPASRERQGQQRRVYLMASGLAAERARRPAARERQGQRRRVYRMGSGSAAESARRPAARERQGQRRRMYRMGPGRARRRRAPRAAPRLENSEAVASA